MGIDRKKANEFIKKLNSLQIFLKENEGLFDKDKLYDFEHITKNFKDKIAIAEDEGRKLCVGIIGAVKAGKSSFLNACIFDGEEVLPKACTPMTAALTRISYGKEPKAIIHFYEKKDWEDIIEKSAEYDRRLDEAYDLYCDEFDMQNSQTHNSNKGSKTINSAKKNRVKKTKQDYEKAFFKNQIGEELSSCKELTEMAKKNDINELNGLLGQTKEVTGTEANSLQEYIGAEGRYTPIVNYVELQRDNKILGGGLEIIDTPGLNDPIKSRSFATKQFLEKCDVAILLSPCSQFMDASVISNMINRFPSAGISNIMVVGSKLDAGILDHRKAKDTFKNAYEGIVKACDNQIKYNISSLIERYPENIIIKQISESDTFYVSSICFGISKKLSEGKPLNKEEKNINDQMQKRFSGYKQDPEWLKVLSGMNNILEAFNQIEEKKENIINESNEKLISDYTHKALMKLDEIIDIAEDRRKKLKTGSIEELKNRYETAEQVLNSTRRDIRELFLQTANISKRSLLGMQYDISGLTSSYMKIHVEKKTYIKKDVVRTGLFKKEIISTPVTEYYVDVQQIIKNLTDYISAALHHILEQYTSLFNGEELERKLKEIVLEAFEKNKSQFDENDILVPLKTLLTRINIPQIEFDGNRYIDKVRSEFKSGTAKNDEIYKLSSMQGAVLKNASGAINEELTKKADEIENMLNEKAGVFTDEIEEKIRNESEELLKQIENKEENLERYKVFVGNIKNWKKDINNDEI